MRRRSLTLSVLAASVLALSACATSPGGSADAPPGFALGSLDPAPPSGEVIGQGTVMDVAGEVELCLGAVMESWPPQCHGIPLDGWTWDGVEGADSSGDVTWGAYAVQGTYDGERFTITQPPMLLALYDPMALDDPTGGVPGTAGEETLLAIQDELPDRLGDRYLESWQSEGRLWVHVVWDDGTWQDAADADFGEDVVVVQSALRLVEG